MTWENWLWLIGTIICAGSALSLLRNYKVVRQKYPFSGWAAYLILVLLSFECYARTGLPL